MLKDVIVCLAIVWSAAAVIAGIYVIGTEIGVIPATLFGIVGLIIVSQLTEKLTGG